jgi:endonuclease G
MTEERLENVTRRLNASPGVQAAIQRAITEGRLPEPIAGAVTAAALDAVGTGADRLERMMPVDALEAIVQRFGRPPLVVENDAVVLEPLDDFPAGTDSLIKGV